jgi:hypothetical protein
VAGLLAAEFGMTMTASAARTQPSAAGRLPVAYNYYRGRVRQHHYYGSIRPRNFGTKGGPPDPIPMRWSYWHRTAAFGHGVVVHMGRHRITLWFHDVQRTRRGVRYYKKLKETWLGGGGVSYFRWNGHDWV